MIVISTHLDDAVFSCGAFLAGTDATVVTICAGIPPASTPPHRFDIAAGFGSAAEASSARCAEDEKAMQLLGVRHVHCPALEINYSDGEPIDRIVEAALHGAGDHTVFGPLGLRHPDHEAVARAFCRVARELDLNAWLYEDLPYAVVFPEYRAAAFEAACCSPDHAHTVDADSGLKREAVSCYASQLPGMDLAALFGTERYHRLNGSAKL